MPITLRNYQLDALTYVDWLLDDSQDSRMSGRSTVIAVALIRLAAEHPSTWVSFRDHVDNIRCRMCNREKIISLTNEDPRLAPYCTFRQKEFSINLPEPIVDWLPIGTTRDDYDDASDSLRYSLTALKKSAFPEEPRVSLLERLLDSLD